MDRARLDPAIVKCLLRAQFPHWADLPLAAVDLDGWDNVTFKLGETMSVRLPSADGYAAQVEKEHRWLPFLAQHLPLTIPRPLARGHPGCCYRWPWSIYRWLEGRPASVERVADLTEFAVTLAGFLRSLHGIDSTSGPPAGEHSFFRGGPLLIYDEETRAAIKELADVIDSEAATEVWDRALAAEWRGPPVWVHGDVAPSNLLVVDGRLSAVIDFGCCAVGDPACDTVIAWTFMEGPSRTAFQGHLPLDEATWARGRGWALWKALITYAEARRHHPSRVDSAELRFGWRMNARSLIEDLLR
ncbi:MAG TPA: aminoglycoside phosphotransferase family protein [Acidimicrobiia bacterium]|nr:aminoglycoside phosphotransferase family protein [Acidimicrobiia bacterium]